MPASTANDLRSEARSYQRDKNHNAKWAKGFLPRNCPHGVSSLASGPISGTDCTSCHARPMHDREHNHGSGRAKRLRQKKENGQANTLARKAFRNNIDDAVDGPLALVTDASSDDDVMDASAAPLPAEADYMYSYDRPSGPANGRDVLSAALNKAVLRFESTETEKLVTREYDVIDQLKEGYAADEDEDDFEMIEHAHLK
ncbi:uncharacterized protein HMPREF1541_02086 [Cyphellophora europaea CBS 101466]|uniref:Uncharacterized protein n=1 Tax=Cyphellophora europaea (strain CBS 101466) TaxID=1220924 RepID=W2S4G2_CYPE1|nr:uncharacterized protein HMPREF1541_02086 [Cyphellophora europaea CBS 101466]ETN42928.1 hypothetical protein HMPREF1541_02086 [Cyphellophora europaea CBS 101466]